MLEEEKHAILEDQAKRKGLSVPTYCRLLLSEWAEVPEIKEAA
jgi:hypothetical protein